MITSAMYLTCRSRAALLSLLVCAGLAGNPHSVRAQDAAQRQIQQLTGQNFTQEEILARLQQSGLSRDEVRTRLTGLGYDPTIADAYFDRLEGKSDQLTRNDDFLAALAQMGVLGSQDAGQLFDSLAVLGTDTDSLPPGVFDAAEPDSAITVFGRSVFAGVTSQFQPVTAAPVDPGYILGPGDQVQLILTGDVELAYNLGVTRDGLIVIPNVGQMSVNGLTLDGLRDALFARLGNVYSGVRRGADATTRFHVSLGQLRTNQVFLVGEVTTPGAYQLSAASTVFNALYNAGGPGPGGSMRSVQLNRGGSLEKEVDLYDYLISGNTSDDVRLEQGDLVFVPFAGPQVTIEGLVRRPAIYEIKPGEGLLDLMRFAGGARAEAWVQKIQIDRVLPANERTPGRERVVVDVDLSALDEDLDFLLLDGDRVTVPSIGDQRDNRVAIEGHVQQPGVFQLAPGMSVSDLIERSGGLLPDAYEEVGHLVRLNLADSTYSLEQFTLDAAGRTVGDVPLRELDRVVIYGRSKLVSPMFVSVFGEVKEPGVFPLQAGMTAQDLVLAAGGFTDRADPDVARLVRLTDPVTLTDTISISMNIVFGREIPSSLDVLNGAAQRNGVIATAERAEDVLLQMGDRVFVRRLQGLREDGQVRILGEVLFPGEYALQTRGERLTSIIARAGGLTPEAFAEGVGIMRDSIQVGVDLEAALANPGGQDDILLFPEDEIDVPLYDATVRIMGEVEIMARVQWIPGRGVGDYLSEAGGVNITGDRGRTSVTYANGTRRRSGGFWFFGGDPEVRPGSTILVPSKPSPGPGFNWVAFSSALLSAATVVVALTR